MTRPQERPSRRSPQGRGYLFPSQPSKTDDQYKLRPDSRSSVSIWYATASGQAAGYPQGRYLRLETDAFGEQRGHAVRPAFLFELRCALWVSPLGRSYGVGSLYASWKPNSSATCSRLTVATMRRAGCIPRRFQQGSLRRYLLPQGGLFEPRPKQPAMVFNIRPFCEHTPDIMKRWFGALNLSCFLSSHQCQENV